MADRSGPLAFILFKFVAIDGFDGLALLAAALAVCVRPRSFREFSAGLHRDTGDTALGVEIIPRRTCCERLVLANGNALDCDRAMQLGLGSSHRRLRRRHILV